MLQNVIFSKEVTVIFKDFVKKTYSVANEFVKNNTVFVRFTAFSLIAVVSLFICAASCGIKIGFNVEYAGETIATVDEKSVFDDAKASIVEKLSDSDGEEYISTPSFNLTVTLSNRLSQADTVADAIIENTDEISLSSALKVNGDVVVYSNRDELDSLISTALSQYYVKGAENTSTFIDDVEISDGYCLKGQIKSTSEVNKAVSKLKVKTVSTVTSESSVKYSTKTIYTSKQNRGYEKVQTKGKKGVKQEVAVVETVNGKETTKTVVSRKVVKKPVQKVVVKGTATPVATATSRAEAKSAGFICPMNKRHIKQISAYWGDGRNHKAIDFAGDVGSPLFAAKAGKVTFSGWDGNYGYAVVIDHGNGYQTRYAHASAVCVRKGDTVTQGQQVAKLGNTGRSTGPHLHFEILKNGKQINPAPYIGY